MDNNRYHGEATVPEVAKQYGLEIDEVIKAEFNENLCPVNPKVLEAFQQFVQTNSSEFGRINTYPYQIDYKDLRVKIAHSISPRLSIDNILLGNGSNEIIDLVCKTFIEPSEEEALLLEPTFGGYRVYLRTYNIVTKSVICEDNLRFDLEKIVQKVSSKTRLCVIAHPNNPTGVLFSRKAMIRLLDTFSNTMFLVDEAYIHFAKQGSSFIDLVEDYDNLIVCRTFSKAFGLAGLRIGLGISDEENIDYMSRGRVSYTANIFAVIAVNAILNDEAYVHKIAEETIEERERMKKHLDEMPRIKKVYPSNGNFLLIRFGDCDAKEIQQRMLERGIIIRNYTDKPKLKNCLRITIGPKKNNDTILENLRDLLESRALVQSVYT